MATRKWLVPLMAMVAIILMGRGTWPQEKVRFASHFKANAYYVMPVLAALEKGFWKEQGLDPVWVPFDSATTMIQAVAAGEIDMGTHGMDSVIIAVSRGVPEVIVADPRMNVEFVIWVAGDSPMKEPRDLKGAKIAVSRFGVTPHRMALIGAKALGIEKDVKFVAAG